MLDALNQLWFGFGVALTWDNLLYCLIGAALGTLVGILPGIGPVTAIALLLPLSFHMPAAGAIIMLAGIYYGATHAGSTTAIMLNMPGEPAAVVICFDGFPMAKKGRAGAALAMAALSSFAAGCVCVLIIAFFSPALGRMALQFGPAEYTSVIILALVSVSVLAGKSTLNTMGMAVLGMALGTVGTDVSSGTTRFTLGALELQEGINFIPVALALFALVDIAFTLGAPEAKVRIKTKLRDLMPTLADIKACIMPVVRGTTIGSAFGILPGTGPLISSFAAYAVEKKLAKDPSRFGQGAIEGVAAPEAAANAAAFTHFIPMLALGIPAGATMALLFGALLIQGVTPGPQMMVQHPAIFWGLIASMWLGNAMLLILNLPLVGVWIKMLETPYRLLYPVILIFCMIGIFSERGLPFDIYICAAVLLGGWVLQRLDCSPAPLVLGIILGPILEENLSRAMQLAKGDPSVFVTQPISAFFLALTVVTVVLFTVSNTRRRRAELAAARAPGAAARDDGGDGPGELRQAP